MSRLINKMINFCNRPCNCNINLRTLLRGSAKINVFEAAAYIYILASVNSLHSSVDSIFEPFRLRVGLTKV